jgi:soluble lytic murein transglycosylase-like protein
MSDRTVWQSESFTAKTMTSSIVRRGAIFAFCMLLLISALGFINPIAGGNARSTFSELEQSHGEMTNELAIARLSLERAARVFDFSTRFGIPADLAAMINDVALSEGIDPELAFRLVSVESGFSPDAISPVGAIGIAQVMLETAEYFDSGITAADLKDPETNLRIGLQHLRYLLSRYGDEEFALLAYNRGTNRIAELLNSDADPRNGYASSIMDGYLR